MPDQPTKVNVSKEDVRLFNLHWCQYCEWPPKWDIETCPEQCGHDGRHLRSLVESSPASDKRGQPCACCDKPSTCFCLNRSVWVCDDHAFESRDKNGVSVKDASRYGEIPSRPLPSPAPPLPKVEEAMEPVGGAIQDAFDYRRNKSVAEAQDNAAKDSAAYEVLRAALQPKRVKAEWVSLLGFHLAACDWGPAIKMLREQGIVIDEDAKQ